MVLMFSLNFTIWLSYIFLSFLCITHADFMTFQDPRQIHKTTKLTLDICNYLFIALFVFIIQLKMDWLLMCIYSLQ